MRKKSAYTTLELLIVLTIIGFFVAMVAPKLVGMFSDSQEKIAAPISPTSRASSASGNSTTPVFFPTT